MQGWQPTRGGREGKYRESKCNWYFNTWSWYSHPEHLASLKGGLRSWCSPETVGGWWPEVLALHRWCRAFTGGSQLR